MTEAAKVNHAVNWFLELTGFSESSHSVKENLEFDGTTLRSKVNGRSMEVGELSTPSVADLSARCKAANLHAGTLRVSEVVADVGALHADPANQGAFFQVASQFNLLEMVSPSVRPESGVTQYEGDKTQGPACAIACGAGTIFRNWFVPIHGKPGQTGKRQLDMLADVGLDLGNDEARLWKMRNGYALATGDGLDSLPDQHELLRIGVQTNAEVTLAGAGHLVTQAYCSALPVAYTNAPAVKLEPLARMILNSSYGATMAAARLHHAAGASPRVYLTLLGGGVFGNPTSWILDAMSRAFDTHDDAPLDVRIVSYGASNPDLAALLR